MSNFGIAAVNEGKGCRSVRVLENIEGGEELEVVTTVGTPLSERDNNLRSPYVNSREWEIPKTRDLPNL